jgi:predicted neutral ceramidase superfamily lipid hydrolase
MQEEEYGGIASKFYSLLVVLPRRRVLLATLLIEILIGNILAILLDRSFLILQFTSVVLLLSVADPIFRDNKRIIGLFAIYYGISLATGILAVTFSNKSLGIGFVSASSFFLLVLFSLIRDNKLAMIESLLLLVTPVTLVSFINSTQLAYYIKVLAFDSVPVILFILWMKKRIYGEDALHLVKAFLRSWIIDENELIEEVLYRNGDKFKVRAQLYLLDNYCLVLTNLHYGPYRRVGSSRLQHLVEEELEKAGIKSVVFHGISTHEQDLARQKDAIEIAKQLIDKVRNNEIVQRSIGRPIVPNRISVEGWEIVTVGGERAPMLIVSNSLCGSDDIPLEILNEVEKIKHSYTSPDLFIVEAHNKELVKKSRGYEELKIAIEKALSEAKYGSKILFGYGSCKVLRKEKGLCHEEVSCLTFKVDEKQISIFVLRGNNIREDGRELVINRFPELTTEVVTTDDHSCAATIAKITYNPIEVNEALIRTMEKALDESQRNLKEVNMHYAEVILGEYKVVGKGAFKLLRIIKEKGKIACLITFALFFWLIFAPVFTSFI